MLDYLIDITVSYEVHILKILFLKNFTVFQLSQEDDVRNVLKLTKEKFGRLDVTINCPYFAKSARVMINVKDVPAENPNLSGEMMDLLFKVN